MHSLKRIPVGLEDFKEIIDKGYYFVDKTLLIKDILDGNSKVSLVTRPRRFGKTLNMSMIQRFFEKTEENNEYLFEGLKITSEDKKYLDHQGKYPVITVSLKSMKQSSYEYAFSEWKNNVIREFIRHTDVLSSEEILPYERKRFEAVIADEADDVVYFTALRFLSECLKKYYKKNVILLVDEYDVPLENAYFCGFYDKMTDLVRSVLESVLKTNPSLEFAVLTGCLRISKESIFTGLNNLGVYPITESRLSEYYGFTQDEVKKMAEEFDLLERLPEMKKWYNGYIFGQTEIYNPWSIVQYMASANGGNKIPCKPYWINTSSNSIIHQLISQSDEKTKKKIEDLMAGKSIKAPVNENTVYSDINVNKEDIWSFLLFTGYLKQVDSEFKNLRTYSEMVIPNLEVMTVYEQTVMNWFDDMIIKERTPELLCAFIEEDTQKVQSEINRWLRKSISFYDSAENFYHGFLLGALLGNDEYEIKSNRENGDGRTDITICEFQTRRLGIVIEIKIAGSFHELDKMCDKALMQIEERQYGEQLLEDCYEKVIKYGIAFCGKSCKIKTGKSLSGCLF
ncbi:MAG: AAA family ATPase [Ruminococcus sp.]|nr:AAA family ATPase [Ruminococcus sp.]